MSIHAAWRNFALSFGGRGYPRDTDPVVCHGDGVPSGAYIEGTGQSLAAAQPALYLRRDPAGSDSVAYVSHDGGTTWTALTNTAFDPQDSEQLTFGTGDDIAIAWDGTRLNVTQAATNSEIRWGVDGAGIDQTWYGDTASGYMRFDQSADSLILTDSYKLVLGTGSDIAIYWDATDLLITQAGTNSAIKVGASGAGMDLLLYGDTAGRDLLWDQSLDSLIFADNATLGLGSGAGAGADITMTWNGTKLLVGQLTANSAIDLGVDGAGIDLVLYGDTASVNVTWDQTADSLIFTDNAKAVFGSGSDIAIAWDASKLAVTQAAPNSAIDLGVDGAGIDLILRGDTASAACTWDQSADSLILTGVAKIKLQTITAADAAAIPVTHSGSLAITQNGAETNTLADPTYLGQTISIFVDTDTSGARVITAASRINQTGNNTITLTEVGDFIKLEAITIGGALKWQVVANDGASLSTV